LAKQYDLCSVRLNAIEDADGKPKGTDFDTLAFKLEVKCEKNPDAEEGETDPHRAYRHANGTFTAVVT
jgi:hypothetical protein